MRHNVLWMSACLSLVGCRELPELTSGESPLENAQTTAPGQVTPGQTDQTGQTGQTTVCRDNEGTTLSFPNDQLTVKRFLHPCDDLVIRVPANPALPHRWSYLPSLNNYTGPLPEETVEGTGADTRRVFTFKDAISAGFKDYQLTYRPTDAGDERFGAIQDSIDLNIWEHNVPLATRVVVDDSNDGETIQVPKGHHLEVRLPHVLPGSHEWVQTETARLPLPLSWDTSESGVLVALFETEFGFQLPPSPRLAFEYRNRKTGKAAARVSYDLALERL